jgi:hypothetical protein
MAILVQPCWGFSFAFVVGGWGHYKSFHEKIKSCNLNSGFLKVH